MPIHELRETTAARQFLLQGLWLQRSARPTKEMVRPVLDWVRELAEEGEPLPPVGFVGDVGHLALQPDDAYYPHREHVTIPSLPAEMMRPYEDYVLGKLYADSTFERATDAVAHYKTDRDRSRGIAFLLSQMRQRAGFGGVLLSPSVIRTLQGEQPNDVLLEGWESFTHEGVSPLLPELYDELIAGVRDTGNVLGMEDVFELEHETPLVEFGQRIALRQVLQVAGRFEEQLPHQAPRTPVRRQVVATKILDEDIYPIGGFTSISNKGTIESLLHSQLAYMEPDTAERPDLFDIKFLRDELLYYSRDENQFLRRRRTFVFALYPDLVHIRVKDAGLSWQRMIVLLGMLVILVRKLLEWLSEDALQFEILFMRSDVAEPLGDERSLLEMIFRSQIANSTVSIEGVRPRDLPARCEERAQRSLCHCFVCSTQDRPFQAENTIVAKLDVNRANPRVVVGDEAAITDFDENHPFANWTIAAETLLREFL